MCPPTTIPSAADIGEFWTDEDLFKSLVKYKSGCPLPLNVISDVNPYQIRPSALPADLWYFCSGVQKDADHGFWMATGDASEIFSDSAIIGLRTTLLYYEGRAPHEQKTNWVMQEYRTTEKCNSKLKDPRALCRIFLADEDILVHPEMASRNCIARIDVTNSIGLVPKMAPNVRDNSEPISGSELLEKGMDNGTEPSALGNRSPGRPIENLPVMDYVSRGDYLELDDLVDPISRSSSSADSSCLTITSEEYFDSMALLRELEDDNMDHELKDPSVKLNCAAPLKPKEVVMRPATLGSLRSGEESKPSTEETLKLDVRTQQGNNGNESTSNSLDTASSSSSSEGTSKGEKKDRVCRAKKRKIMKFLCFMAF